MLHYSFWNVAPHRVRRLAHSLKRDIGSVDANRRTDSPMSMTSPMTTLTRGQYAPLLHRSSAAPRSTSPQHVNNVFLRRDLRLRADYFANPSIEARPNGGRASTRTLNLIISLHTLLLSALLLLANTAIAGQVAALLAKSPETEAERAFGAGDQRHIVTPICDATKGEVLPGWPLEYSPAHLDALEKGKRPIVCTDLGSNPQGRTLAKIVGWAEKYNLRLLRLQSRGRK